MFKSLVVPLAVALATILFCNPESTPTDEAELLGFSNPISNTDFPNTSTATLLIPGNASWRNTSPTVDTRP